MFSLFILILHQFRELGRDVAREQLVDRDAPVWFGHWPTLRFNNSAKRTARS
jgi:hypothetical protein